VGPISFLDDETYSPQNRKVGHALMGLKRCRVFPGSTTMNTINQYDFVHFNFSEKLIQ